MTISIDTVQTTNLNALKKQGCMLLNANQVEAAIQIYLRILREYPEDVEAYLFLGDCYLNNDDLDAALLLYQQALEHAPDDEKVLQKIHKVDEMKNRNKISNENIGGLSQLSESTIPTNPQEIAEILQKITNQELPITEEEVMRAAQLLDEIIHSASPAQLVAQRLDEIDDLLPALLELNIRQARADHRYDLVEGLQNLLKNIILQREHDVAHLHKPPQISIKKPLATQELRIRFIGSQAGGTSRRMMLLRQSLKEAGCQITITDEKQPRPMDQFDVVIAQNPHSETWMMELLAEAHGAKVPIILSVESDLEQMPVNHSDYETIGLGTPLQSKAYAAALLLADAICVPGEVLGNNLRAAGYPTHIIPDVWPDNDILWKKPVSNHSMLNLGWVGTPGQVEDVFSIRRMVVRVMREFPHVCMVIGGDPEVYRLFDTLPEARRIFMPSIDAEDYPYLLRQIDILLVPFRNTPFNRSRSDNILVDAGALGIPWIASPIKAHVDWASGGLIANTPDEWHTYMRQLIMDNELRASIGSAGLMKSETRKMSIIFPQWLELIRSVL